MTELLPTGLDAFESAPCGYVIVDARGIVARANEEFLRMLDAPAGDVVGVRTFSSLVSTGGQILLETHVRPILDHAGVVREIAVELVRADGGRVPVLLNARIVCAEPRTVLVVLVETRDRHRYEDYLLAAKRAAEQIEQMDGQLAAISGADGKSTLITERNAKALSVLRQQLDAGKKRIGIFYGAGHFRHMGEELETKFQMHPVKTVWLDAWNMKQPAR